MEVRTYEFLVNRLKATTIKDTISCAVTTTRGRCADVPSLSCVAQQHMSAVGRWKELRPIVAQGQITVRGQIQSGRT